MDGNDVRETARRLVRTAGMSAALMRDPTRTGGWPGAERVARAFDRLCESGRELHETLLEPSPAESVMAFAKAVQHGSEAHRRWLMAAAEAFVAHRPLPPPDAPLPPVPGDPVENGR